MNPKAVAITIAVGLAVSIVGCKRTPPAEMADFDSRKADEIVDEHGMQYPKRAYEEGRRRAKHDLQQGILATETFGLPGPAAAEYSTILHDRYQIGEIYHGCVVSSHQLGSAQGYNAIMIPEIKRRFGEGIFERVAKEAAQMDQEKKRR